MMEKSHFRETFFSVKNVPPPRPDSVHTEFMETDWEEDDILSELDDGDSSPRLSLDSVSTLLPASQPSTALTLSRVWTLTRNSIIVERRAKYDDLVHVR